MNKEGSQAYLVYMNGEAKDEKKIEDISIMRDFKEVFSKALPGLPLERQLDFTIDLKPGAAPVSKAPYRMIPKELQELKIQLQ